MERPDDDYFVGSEFGMRLIVIQPAHGVDKNSQLHSETLVQLLSVIHLLDLRCAMVSNRLYVVGPQSVDISAYSICWGSETRVGFDVLPSLCPSVGLSARPSSRGRLPLDSYATVAANKLLFALQRTSGRCLCHIYVLV